MKKRVRLQVIVGRVLLSLLLSVSIVAVSFFVFKYQEIFKSDAVIASAKIAPGDTVVINFSKQINPQWKGMRIALQPEAEFSMQWARDKKQLVIKPKTLWKPGAMYALSFQGKTVMFASVVGEFTFEVDPYPKVESFYPLDGEKDVISDIEDPISVSFNRALNDYAVKFSIDPKAELAYEMDENRKIKLLPKLKLEEGKKYTIDVYLRHKKEPTDAYRKIYTSSFETKIFLTPDKWEKDPVIKLEQARKYTNPIIKEGKYIDVNLQQQVMVLFENGIAQDAYLISSGKKGMETPKGSFQIYNKAERVWSKKYSLYMPYWMAILPSGEVGIHELPEWPGGFKEGANHLGLPVSHGCVRLGVGAAQHVFNWSAIGTKVVVH